MKCGDCGCELNDKVEREQGVEIHVYVCPNCKKELMDYKEAIRLQRRILQRIEETRPVVRVGNSIGITFPARIKTYIKVGDRIHMIWDMETKKAELIVE